MSVPMSLSPAKSPFLSLSQLFFLKPRIVSCRSRNRFLPFRYFFLLLSLSLCHFHLFSCITLQRGIESSRLSCQACIYVYIQRIHAGIYAVTCAWTCAHIVDNCEANEDERGRKLVREECNYLSLMRYIRKYTATADDNVFFNFFSLFLSFCFVFLFLFH